MTKIALFAVFCAVINMSLCSAVANTNVPCPTEPKYVVADDSVFVAETVSILKKASLTKTWSPKGPDKYEVRYTIYSGKPEENRDCALVKPKPFHK